MYIGVLKLVLPILSDVNKNYQQIKYKISE